MKLYSRLEALSYWCRWQATYLEMKYHLKKVLKGKERTYLKPIYHHDRAIGKSVALCRLAVKYSIPIIVPTYRWKEVIEGAIPVMLPKYFKKRKPLAIVENEEVLRGLKLNVFLLEERLSDDCINWLKDKYYVGYINY